MIYLLVAVSLFGLALLPLLALSPYVVSIQTPLRQIIVGGLFSALCILGILAAFYPAKCKGVFQKQQNPLPASENNLNKIVGHHPDCEQFSANRIKLGNQSVCAACSGLLIGAIVALTSTIAYFFIGVSMGVGNIWILMLGDVGMLVGLTQIWLASIGKVAVNTIFVVGSAVVLIESDILRQNLVLDLYALGLIAFVLWLRILLSEWNNKRTCNRCKVCF